MVYFTYAYQHLQQKYLNYQKVLRPLLNFLQNLRQKSKEFSGLVNFRRNIYRYLRQQVRIVKHDLTLSVLYVTSLGSIIKPPKSPPCLAIAMGSVLSKTTTSSPARVGTWSPHPPRCVSVPCLFGPINRATVLYLK